MDIDEAIKAVSSLTKSFMKNYSNKMYYIKQTTCTWLQRETLPREMPWNATV